MKEIKKPLILSVIYIIAIMVYEVYRISVTGFSLYSNIIFPGILILYTLLMLVLPERLRWIGMICMIIEIGLTAFDLIGQLDMIFESPEHHKVFYTSILPYHLIMIALFAAVLYSTLNRSRVHLPSFLLLGVTGGGLMVFRIFKFVLGMKGYIEIQSYHTIDTSYLLNVILLNLAEGILFAMIGVVALVFEVRRMKRDKLLDSNEPFGVEAAN
ncbi:MAG: hypothetical protein ACC608_06650 [Anaerofustis sp.]